MVKNLVVVFFLLGILLANIACVGIVLLPFYFFDPAVAIVLAGVVCWPVACGLWFVMWVAFKTWIHS